MKKIILILIIIIAAIGGGVYYFLTTKETSQQNQNITTNENNNVNNDVSQVGKAPTPIYQEFKEEGGDVSFATAKDWTSIAPEEVTEGITEEQLNGYQVIYYSVSKEGLIQAVSKKSFTQEETTINKIFEQDLAFSKKTAPDYQVENKEQREQEIRWESPVTINNSPYTIFSRGILKTQEADNKDWYYLLEVSVPDNLKEKYSEIISYLIISMYVAEV